MNNQYNINNFLSDNKTLSENGMLHFFKKYIYLDSLELKEKGDNNVR